MTSPTTQTAEVTQEEPSPCPICGGAVEVTSEWGPGTMRETEWRIGCRKTNYSAPYHSVSIWQSGTTRAGIIRAWNTRQPASGDVEAVTRAIERAIAEHRYCKTWGLESVPPELAEHYDTSSIGAEMRAEADVAARAALSTMARRDDAVVTAATQLVHAWDQPLIDQHGYANSERFGGEHEAKSALIQAVRALKVQP